jgi:hypothetical protein
MVFSLAFGAQLEAPVARLLREQLHCSFDRAMKIAALDQYARSDLLAFDIEKTALKVNHQRALVEKCRLIGPDFIEWGFNLRLTGGHASRVLNRMSRAQERPFKTAEVLKFIRY